MFGTSWNQFAPYFMLIVLPGYSDEVASMGGATGVFTHGVEGVERRHLGLFLGTILGV